MKINLLLLLLMAVFEVAADSSVTLDLVVTNQDVQVQSVQGLGNISASYVQANKLIRVDDDYPDFKVFNILTVGNHQGALHRRNSQFSIELAGKKYGKRILIPGKMVHSKLISTAVSASFSRNYNTGCSRVYPSTAVATSSAHTVEINSSEIVSANCVGLTGDVSWQRSSGQVPIHSAVRRFVISIDNVLDDAVLTSLPPDIYTGHAVYNDDGWVSRVPEGKAGSYYPKLTINVNLEKKSFFSGLVIGDNNVTFSVHNHNEPTGYRVSGRASTAFNLVGAFSDQDKIKIDARSANNFRLTAAGGATIPYSVGVTYRGVTTPLVVAGNKQSPVILSPGLLSSTVTGSLAFDFSTPASQVHNGMFSDNLTLMAELVL